MIATDKRSWWGCGNHIPSVMIRSQKQIDVVASRRWKGMGRHIRPRLEGQMSSGVLCTAGLLRDSMTACTEAVLLKAHSVIDRRYILEKVLAKKNWDRTHDVEM